MPLGLKFADIGERIYRSTQMLFYWDELIRIYGSKDFNTAAGASFAVENWAVAGFWKDLITGLGNSRDIAALRSILGSSAGITY